MPVPQLRPLDIVPFKAEGQDLFQLRDPDGISPGAVVNAPTLLLTLLLNGRNEIADLQSIYAQKSNGHEISTEEIEGLISDLDTQGLLLTDRFLKKLKAIEEEFDRAPFRKSALAGSAYALEPDQLRKDIDGYFTQPDGPGTIGAPASDGKIAGAIAPHIDFTRGGVTYAHAYKRIAERARHAETFVILGVAHTSPPVPYSVLDKPFATPLGMAPVDTDVIERLRRTAPAWAFEHALCHRTEHSIEFQAVFLHYIRPDLPFKIVPILCGSFEMACGEEAPERTETVNAFIGALKEAIAPLGEKAFILSGADLAHVGPRFGDPEPMTDAVIQQMVREDAPGLECIRKGDAEGFYRSVMADGNRRKVCGLGSIYTALRLLGPRAGEVLRYDHAPDPAQGEVSFVSAVF